MQAAANDKMTIIELFPWLLALCVTVLSTAAFRRYGVTETGALSLGLVLGLVSWLLYVFGGKLLGSWLGQRQLLKEKSERERRVYQTFDPTEDYRASKNLFYECAVCGNAVPSLSRKSVRCTCQNIRVQNSSGSAKIQNRAKVKLFSLAPS